MTSFDPYLNWLGIPVHEQPPNFYRLLGVVLFESNPTVIEQAADRQSLTVGANQGGPQGELCQRILSEIAMARYNLLDPRQKANYDANLQEMLAHRGERAVAAPPPPSVGGAMPPAPPQPQFSPPQSFVSPPLPQPLPPQPAYTPAMQPVTRPFPVAQQMMPSPQGIRGAMPAPSSTFPPSPIPVAVPFPTARAVTNGAAPNAPPAIPPAAPKTPMEELESLAAQSAARGRLRKKKRRADYSKEIMFGGIAAAAAVVLVIIYIAAHGPIMPGLGGLGDHSGQSVAPSVSEKPKADKDKTSAAVATAKPKNSTSRTSSLASPPRPKSPVASDDNDSSSKVQVTNSAPRQPNRKDIDSPQQLGGPDDPVMGKPDE
jgi:hypothetical protein